MVSEVSGIGERFQRAGIGLKDALAVIEMTLEDQRGLIAQHPQELFDGLNASINATVHGTTIERFRPGEGGKPFHVFEIHTAEGETLGYLNMLYLRKPIPCYYLVYVEVLPPFRGRGLGNRIIESFRSFALEKGAVGLLDNIIPPEEPTFDMYSKLGFVPVQQMVGEEIANGGGNYMVWIPSSVRIQDLRDKMIKLLFNLRKKRPVIDMKDNEAMVKRTIEEFRSVYHALVRLFEAELSAGASTALMRFMFTKFATRLVGFRRRISHLLGYTGGESLEQIAVDHRILGLPIQPFSLWGPREARLELWAEDEALAQRLPQALKEDPTSFIEALPLYRRPYLSWWLPRGGDSPPEGLTISDIFSMGFDPTRLREFLLGQTHYIFERLSPRVAPTMERKRALLTEVSRAASGRRFRTATLKTNPPLVLVEHRGNLYVLRRKVEGIHSEEALDQLRGAPHLREMNRALGMDRTLLGIIREAKTWLASRTDRGHREELEELVFFVPWDLERNMPMVSVDAAGPSVDTLWIA
jgi:GNAT superfamily N-acetyltransferase